MYVVNVRIVCILARGRIEERGKSVSLGSRKKSLHMSARAGLERIGIVLTLSELVIGKAQESGFSRTASLGVSIAADSRADTTESSKSN